jgi:hypothetical protein
MSSPSTAQILAYRELQWPGAGEAFIQWAVGRLEAGDDGPCLRRLAGMDPSQNQFELQGLLEGALKEVGLRSLRGDAAVKLYAGELLSGLLRGTADTREVLGLLKEFYLARDRADYLQAFYLLHFALADLEQYGDQRYWPSATEENILEVIADVARSWLAEHATTG